MFISMPTEQCLFFQWIDTVIRKVLELALQFVDRLLALVDTFLNLCYSEIEGLGIALGGRDSVRSRIIFF